MIKKSLFLYFILISCTSTSYLTKEQTEKVYTHRINLDKSDIRKKLLLFVNENYHSAASVIQTDEDGIFAGNGIIILDEYGGIPGLASGVDVKAEITFIIQYSDKEYTAKWILKDIIAANKSTPSFYWGNYAKQLKYAFNENDQNLFHYLSK